MAIQMPPGVARLPRDKHGRPIPWFVRVDKQGVPDFRLIRDRGITDAYNDRRCWVCGERRGAYVAFVIGPMCAINRITSEPPSHRPCAEYSAQACPFLATPTMRRRTQDLPEDRNIAGVHVDRNPGAALVWVTRSFRPKFVPNGVLFEIGDPTHVGWYAHGREATSGEVWQSIEGGLPFLRAAAELDGPRGLAELERELVAAERYLPPRPTRTGVENFTGTRHPVVYDHDRAAANLPAWRSTLDSQFFTDSEVTEQKGPTITRDMFERTPGDPFARDYQPYDPSQEIEPAHDEDGARRFCR